MQKNFGQHITRQLLLFASYPRLKLALVFETVALAIFLDKDLGSQEESLGLNTAFETNRAQFKDRVHSKEAIYSDFLLVCVICFITLKAKRNCEM